MDTRSKLDIEKIIQAMDFVKLVDPSEKGKVDWIKNKIEDMKSKGDIYTPDVVSYLLDLYSNKANFPNIDRVLEVVNVVNAANQLEKTNKLYYERKTKLWKFIQDLVKTDKIFDTDGILSLIKYWRQLGLPELSTVIKTTGNLSSPTQIQANKVGDSSYKDLDPQYTKNIPDHLKKIALDQINTLEELTGLNVSFQNPSTTDTTNYKLFPTSTHEYIKRTLENLSKMSKSRAILKLN